MRQPGYTNQNHSSPPARLSGRSKAVPASVAGPRLVLLVCTTLLVVLGIVMVFSASSVAAISAGEEPYADGVRQLEYALIGIVGCVIVRFIPHRVWAGPFTWAVFGLSVVFLVLTAVMGTEELGAQRWLTLGPVNFQPSEVAKVGILLLTAKLFNDYQDGGMDFKQFIGCFGALNVLVIGGLILMAQSDLGTTIICVVGIIAIMWLAEVQLKFLGGYVAAVGVVGAFAMFAGYRWQRLTAFMHPYDDYYGTGYQIIHSMYAFAQGGVFGSGLGHSAEKYLYLPEAQTDFIFSIIGEELGMVGAVAVIVAFLAFLGAGLRMAQNAPDRFGAIICGSFAIIIVFQAFLNIGCAMGVMPITGKPLPFISAGGTSLIVSLVMVGFMLSVSHGSDESPDYRRRREDLRLVRTGGNVDDYGRGWPDEYGYSGRGTTRRAPSRKERRA